MSLTPEELQETAKLMKTPFHLLTKSGQQRKGELLGKTTYEDMVEIDKINGRIVPEDTYVFGTLTVYGDHIGLDADIHYASEEGCVYNEETGEGYYIIPDHLQDAVKDIMLKYHKYSCYAKYGRLGEPNGPIVRITDDGPRPTKEEINNFFDRLMERKQ